MPETLLAGCPYTEGQLVTWLPGVAIGMGAAYRPGPFKVREWKLSKPTTGTSTYGASSKPVCVLLLEDADGLVTTKGGEPAWLSADFFTRA